MIASLRGVISQAEGDQLVLEIGGVGFSVSAPVPLCARLRAGEQVALFTHLVVREDALQLYGFETMEEQALFGELLGVNGVGPRLALAILSTLTPDAIQRAVFHDQPEVFSRVPGVGKKTAQKIQFHLQDRLPVVEGLVPALAVSDADAEIIAALTSLGYSVVEAQTALQSVPRDAPADLESRIRLALQYFAT